jgi:hypothetical protein
MTEQLVPLLEDDVCLEPYCPGGCCGGGLGFDFKHLRERASWLGLNFQMLSSIFN